jgi:membrane protease YdiL (CAAX protease family)
VVKDSVPALNQLDSAETALDPFSSARARMAAFLSLSMMLIAVLAFQRLGIVQGVMNPWAMLFAYALAGCMLLLYMRLHHVDFKRLIGPLNAGGYGGLILLAPFALLPFTMGTLWLQMLVLHTRTFDKSPFDLPASFSLTHVAVIAGVVFVGPVFEELSFRGFLLHRWARKWGLKAAIVASGLSFGLLHASIIGSMATGVVLSLLYLRTRRLFASTLLHAWYNSIVVLLGFVSAAHPAKRTPDHMPASFGVFCLVVGSALLLPLLWKLSVGLQLSLPYDWRELDASVAEAAVDQSIIA